MENRLTQELLNPFLFAVPAVEALGVMLLPMLAASDLPFPRLSAFAICGIVIGGLVFFTKILYDVTHAAARRDCRSRDRKGPNGRRRQQQRGLPPVATTCKPPALVLKFRLGRQVRRKNRFW
jgi:hypothetical protein